MMVTVDNNNGRIGCAGLAVISMVLSSITFVVISIPPKYFAPISQDSLSLFILASECATSPASNALPSENLTPLRRLKRQVPPPISFQPSARRGCKPFWGCNSVMVSEIFCNTTRPILEREASQGSTMSSSSDKTMVTLLACAIAGKAIIKDSNPQFR